MSAATSSHRSWDTVTEALEREGGEGRTAGSWTKYCCPVHEPGGGHHPSLGVKYLVNEHKTKVKCFAGCPDEQILDKLGLGIRDLFDDPITRGKGAQRAPQPARKRTVTRAERAIDAAGIPLSKPKKDLGPQVSAWKQTAVYPYLDAEGTVAGEVVRREARFQNGRDKRFHQHRWDPQQGRMVDGGFEPLPFNLPAVLAGIESGEPIYVVEGEKDALTAARAGLIATTNVGGAGSWSAEHGRWLHGAGEVVIVVDHDAPGYRRADRVMDSLAGRVQSVRVVEAATGKDLTDHINAGHHVDELMPVPYLDPLTTTSAAVDPAAAQLDPPTHPQLDGGSPMGEISGLDQAAPHQHDDSVEQVVTHFSQIVQMLLQHMITAAQRIAAERLAAAQRAAALDEAARRLHDEQLAAEQKAIETHLAKLQERGWDRATRTEIAEAVRDAAAWAENSEHAKRALGELSSHVHTRWGLHLDVQNGYITLDTPELGGALAKAEQERAGASRVATAQDRMVSLIAAEPGLDESKKSALYADIETWKNNPSGHSLNTLTEKLQSAGVGRKTRGKVRFVAVYLGAPGLSPGDVPVSALGTYAAVRATNELRKLPEPLVDPGEEIKPRLDTMLLDYQSRLRHGLDTGAVQARLAEAVQVLTPEDQEKARDRGTAIRANPAEDRKPLWPKHVDRDELAATVRMYALAAPQIEAATVGDRKDAQWFAAQRKRHSEQRAYIERAIKSGEGLHEFERDQLKAVLADVEAGITKVPDVLFVDDRSAAAADRDRADEIARVSTVDTRRQLEEILASAEAPAHVNRQVHAEISAVLDGQTQLAAGRWTLGDYERRDLDSKLGARLTAAGCPESLRNRVRNELDYATGQSASTGKTAHWIQEQWVDRREVVAAGRVAAKPAYDGAQRISDLETDLGAQGLTPDQIDQRKAAAAGRGRPISAAVQQTPGEVRKHRSTEPGAGMRRAYGKGHNNGPELGR